MRLFRIFGFALTGMVLLSIAVSCSEEKSPTDINTHPQGWNDVNSTVFHGKKVAANNGIDNCMTCHGETLDDGGESGVACTDCHNTSQVERVLQHDVRVQGIGWEIESCTYCHGNNYTGNEQTGDCTNCHTNDGGPEACNTCHGDFAASDPLTPADIAPPADLYGETRPFSIGVGLHQFHLDNGLSCIGCHTQEVQNFDDHSHIDGDGIADVNSTFIKSWDREGATCTASCHIRDGEFVEKQWTY